MMQILGLHFLEIMQLLTSVTIETTQKRLIILVDSDKQNMQTIVSLLLCKLLFLHRQCNVMVE